MEGMVSEMQQIIKEMEWMVRKMEQTEVNFIGNSQQKVTSLVTNFWWSFSSEINFSGQETTS